MPPSAPSPQVAKDSEPSDRLLRRLLLLFFLALYLITAGGHGYSPDGDFAFRMARSLTVDPKHEYLRTMGSGFSHWGVVVPLLSQPLALLGEPLARLMPQKDYTEVDGRTHLLGIFRRQGLPEEAPTVGPRGSVAGDSYVRRDLPAGTFTSLAAISFLAHAREIPQGTTVAEIVLRDAAGGSVVLPLRAGVETAEWSLGEGGEGAGHRLARVASIWSGNTSGRNYYVELPFGRSLEPRELAVRYLLPEGALYFRTLILQNRETGDLRPIASDHRMWSERETHELFTAFFYSFYNPIVTAVGCVLVFMMARILGYGPLVSVVATLLYGLATAAWPYSKYDFSEPTLVVLTLGTLYLILRWERERRDRLLLAAGALALAAVGTKYFWAGVIPFLLLQILLFHWQRQPSRRALPGVLRPILLFCLPFVAVAVPAVWYLSQRFGYWPLILESWDGWQRGWFPLPMEIGLRGLLFSPGRSFFLYSPPAVLALASAVPFVRRHGIRAMALLALILIYFSPAYTMKPVWHSGAGWGPRYQVLVIPFVILVAAPLIEKALDRRSRLARYALLAAFVLGIGVQLLGVSKNFEVYLGVFKSQIVGQLPDQGARYGGADYYPYAVGLSEGNAITATVWAWPFSPILAHTWLLSADLLDLGPSWLQHARDVVLTNPPWRLWGIGVRAEHPEHGLGLDFWTMRLRSEFPSFTLFLGGVFFILLLLEAVLLFSAARLAASLLGGAPHGRRASRACMVLLVLALVIFDGIHLLL